ARVDQPLLSDLERSLPRLLSSRGEGRAAGEPEAGRGPAGTPPLHPEAPPAPPASAADPALLAIDAALVEDWLVRFLVEEMVERRGFRRAAVGLSGGVDSAVTAALCARALGPENVHAFLLPHRASSPESGAHARLVAGALGIPHREIDITGAVEGYLSEHEPEADARRRGNVMARTRM
ncbi:MAG: NAD(+) synthase, partial [Longimicrobiales bacterium]|nr:NAD(+) synthase [Longimicrobiales bacterium]